jgi:hypothetical protein
LLQLIIPNFHESIGYIIRLHEVEVFDEVKPPTPDTGIDTGGSSPYGCLLKYMVFAFSMAFLSGA